VRAAFVVLIVVFGLLSMMRTRFAGLNLYVWFALFRPQEFAWGAVDGLRLSMVVFVSFVGSSLVTGIFPDFRHPLSILTVLFLIAILLAQLNAADPAVAWFWFQVLATTIIVVLLFIRMTDTRKRFVWVTCIVAGSLGFFGAKYGVGYLIGGGVQFSQGTGGMFADNNDFALAIARVIFLVIAAAQNAPWRWARWSFGAAVPLCILGIISTFSRGGFLGLAGGVLAFVLLQRRRLLTLSVASALVMIALLVIPIPAEYYDRLSTISASDQMDSSSAGRVHYWRVAIVMIRDNPFGVGLKNYEVNYDKYDFLDGRYGTNRAVHNTYLQVLTETGYLGLAIFALLIIVSVGIAFRIRRNSRTPGLDPGDARFLLTSANALLASTAAFLVGGTFASHLLNDLNWFTFALVASLDLVARQMVAEAARQCKSAGGVATNHTVSPNIRAVRIHPGASQPVKI